MATWVISFLFFSLIGVDILPIAATTASAAFCTPRAERHRVGAAGDHLEALAIDRVGQHGGRGGAVAGDLVGLRGRLFDELRPEVFLRVVEIDLFGDGDAVFGDFGAPQPLSRTALRPRGPRVVITARASLLTPMASGCRAWSSYTICFATLESSSCGLVN